MPGHGKPKNEVKCLWRLRIKLFFSNPPKSPTCRFPGTRFATTPSPSPRIGPRRRARTRKPRRSGGPRAGGVFIWAIREAGGAADGGGEGEARAKEVDMTGERASGFLLRRSCTPKPRVGTPTLGYGDHHEINPNGVEQYRPKNNDIGQRHALCNPVGVEIRAADAPRVGVPTLGFGVEPRCGTKPQAPTGPARRAGPTCGLFWHTPPNRRQRGSPRRAVAKSRGRGTSR